ncbi:Type I transmembrane sorting receptor, partial [Kappamyces sp. JEL0680]
MFDSAAVSCLQSVFVALVLLNGLAASRRPSLEELKRLSLPSQNASQISLQNKNILSPRASVFSLPVRKAAVALPGQNGTLQNLYNGLLYIGEAVVGSDVSGKIYTAPVSIAGLNATIPVGVSEVENAQGDIDGLIGLGFNGVDNSNIEAALDGKPANLFDAFGLKGSQNVFGFSFDHLGEGKFTFGGVDSSSWNGTPSYFPVLAASKTDYLGWIVDGSAVSVYVGGKKPLKPTPLGANGPSYVLVDTGTSAIILSEQVAKLVNAAIGSGDYDSQDGIWDIPCSVRDSGPEVILAFSPQGPYYHVPPSLYVWNDPEDTQYCQSQFMSGADMGDGSTLTILG